MKFLPINAQIARTALVGSLSMGPASCSDNKNTQAPGSPVTDDVSAANSAVVRREFESRQMIPPEITEASLRRSLDQKLEIFKETRNAIVSVYLCQKGKADCDKREATVKRWLEEEGFKDFQCERSDLFLFDRLSCSLRLFSDDQAVVKPERRDDWKEFDEPESALNHYDEVTQGLLGKMLKESRIEAYSGSFGLACLP